MMEVIASVLTVLGAAYALSARDLMRGMLGLTTLFLGIATWFAVRGALFLAAAQVFLFVGGVVSLFVLAFNARAAPVQRANPMLVLVALALLVALAAAIPSPAARVIGTGALAQQLIITYGWHLLLGVLVLIAGLIGARAVLEGQ